MPTALRQPPLVAFVAVALVVVAATLWNLHQPLVRNGFVYARVSEHVIAHGFDPRPIVADSRLSYDKPVGFAWLAAPFVALLGNHIGLRVASMLGTIAYLFAAWRLLLAFDPFGFSLRERALALVVAGLSPIVVYQGWSAHPDSLFAAVWLLAVTLSLQIVQRPSTPRSLGLLALLLLAVWLKNYGMVLLPCCALWFLLHARTLWRADERRRPVLLLGIMVAIVAAAIGSAWLGHNPLLRVHGEGGGADQYGRGNLWLSAGGTCLQLGLLLLVNVHLALLACVRGHALRNVARTWRVWLCFPVPYVALLLPFPTTFYNMRYFVPLLPFVAVVAVGGLRQLAAPAARALRIAFVVVALGGIALFDCGELYRACRPALPKLEVDWLGVPLSLLDNLRLPLHLDEQAWLDNVNRAVPPGGSLWFVDCNYYGDARHGVFERAGLLRPDLMTHYVSSRDLPQTREPIFVQATDRVAAALQRLGEVTDRGLGLFEVRPRG